MARLGVLLALISFLVQNSESGRRGRLKHSMRIVNGVQGEQSDFPFLANVQKKNGEAVGDWIRWGSGAIISRYDVLTACHVIANLGVAYESFNRKAHPDHKPQENREPGYLSVLSWKQFRVYVGSGNNLFEKEPTSQYRYAKRLIPHPNCEADTQSYVKNDVGVIRLQRPFDYNVRVQPIAVPSLDPDEALNIARNLQDQQIHCKAVGWGDTEDEQNNHLFWLANVRLVANEFCWNKFDVDHYVCTLSESHSMCSGDAGGPLVCQGYLLGLHSSSNCTPGHYNYMANIEPIVYMINHHVRLDTTLEEDGGKSRVRILRRN